MQPNAPSPQPNPAQPADDLQNVDNPLSVMQPGERVICHIKRHPFGLITLYMSMLIPVIAIMAIAVFFPHYINELSDHAKNGVFFGALLLIAIILIYTYIATIVYKGNRWIVTSDSITQIAQTSLFFKQTSQLSLGNLEDVTFEQRTLIETMFGFGTLRVESAGERSKFLFPYCPRPDHCAREIIGAHEQYMLANPDGIRRDNAGISVPGASQLPPSPVS